MRKTNKKVSLAKKPFLVLSRRAIAGWLTAIFFVCAWMFAIGVLVGRGTSPLKLDINALQKKLEVARAELMQNKKRPTRENADSGKNKPELEFYEALPQNREDAEIPTLRPPPQIKKKTEPPTEKKLSFKKKESRKKLTKTRPKGEDKAQASQQNPGDTTRPPATIPKNKNKPAGKAYTIQVAAFRAVGDADKAVTELKKNGFSAYRAIGKVPGKGIWYRVRVGEYRNKAEASKTLAKLKNKGMQPVLVEK